eukprot:6323836-Pyramimonas_sp.AAC.1
MEPLHQLIPRVPQLAPRRHVPTLVTNTNERPVRAIEQHTHVFERTEPGRRLGRGRATLASQTFSTLPIGTHPAPL